jgi:hypothetical protein
MKSAVANLEIAIAANVTMLVPSGEWRTPLLEQPRPVVSWACRRST